MNNNPFAQSSENWEVEIDVTECDLGNFLIYFETISETISYFEINDSLFTIKAFLDFEITQAEMQDKIAEISTISEATCPIVRVSKVDDVDWISKIQDNFKPFHAGEFFIHAASDEASGMSIRMSAGRAFGTGEHETSFGCLCAISNFNGNPKKILDLGTGSGILAIACKKKWPNAVVHASDVDAESVKTAQKNFEQNDVEVKSFVACGVSQEIMENGPYDLIIANILAEPLISMASEISNVASDNIVIILSGMLESQKNKINEAYELAGMKCLQVENHSGWLVMNFCAL